MADSIILATARMNKARAVTGDAHFRNLNSVMIVYSIYVLFRTCYLWFFCSRGMLGSLLLLGIFLECLGRDHGMRDFYLGRMTDGSRLKRHR